LIVGHGCWRSPVSITPHTQLSRARSTCCRRKGRTSHSVLQRPTVLSSNFLTRTYRDRHSLPAGTEDGDGGDNIALEITLHTPVAMERVCGSLSVRWTHSSAGTIAEIIIRGSDRAERSVSLPSAVRSQSVVYRDDFDRKFHEVRDRPAGSTVVAVCCWLRKVGFREITGDRVG